MDSLMPQTKDSKQHFEALTETNYQIHMLNIES